MSIKCEICGRKFKTPQGLRGHKTFVHQMTNAKGPPARLATEQGWSEMEGRTEKREIDTGLLDELLTPIRIAAENLNNRLTEIETTDLSEKRMTRLCSYCDDFSIRANTKDAEIRFLNEHIEQQHPDKPLASDKPVIVREEDGLEYIIAERYEC